MLFLRILLAALLILAPVSAGMAKPGHAMAGANISQAGSTGKKTVSIILPNAELPAKLPLKPCPGGIFGHTICTSYVVTPIPPVCVATTPANRLSGPRSDDVPTCSDRDGIFHPPRS